MTVSMVSRCYETETSPISFDEIWETIRSGDHQLKGKITQIRNRYEAERDITGSAEKAKKAVADLKLELPGFLPSGTFSKRETGCLVEYSGILCADLDSLGDRLHPIREILKSMPFVRAIALSPSGDGLKVFFNVVNDPARHEDSFRSIKDNLLAIEVTVDEKCKDPTRICFFTYDPDLWLRLEGNEILPPADPEPRATPPVLTSADVRSLTSREQIAFGLLGELKPAPEKGGYFIRCPGESFHTAKTAGKHTILYLATVPTIACQHQSCSAAVESFNKVLRSEIGKAEFRPESRVSHPYRDTRSETLSPNGSQVAEPPMDSSYFSLSTPKTFSAFIPDAKQQLIGDYHIVKDKGFVFAIGGPPGCGKSLATVSLGIAGSRGEGEWFGMKVHRKFKTLIIQTENGLFRLSRIFKELDCESLEDYIRISEPPQYGLLFQRSDFRALVAKSIAEFAPDVVLLDPWNSVARDQEQRTYLDTFAMVRSVLPTNDTPALGIVAHTRKPQTDERASGRALMHLLAGSHVLVTVPRTVFVLQPASDDTEDNQVVWTCCKNNDGAMGKRTAWERKIGLFDPVPKFDWSTFDASTKDKRVVITAEMVEEVFEGGALIRSLARDKLLDISGASKAAVYKALSPTGRFADNLIFKGDTINWLRKA
jgi:hypothetical protein